MRSLRFIIPLALFGVLCVFLHRGLALDPRELHSPLIGKPAPSFALTRLDDANTRIARDDMLGKVWVLNVWASWCAACRDEHPTLLAFSQTNAVPIIGLNYKDTRAEGLAWLQQMGNPYTASAYDSEGKVGIDLGAYGVPETFVIDKGGVVRFKQVGPLTPEIIQLKILPVVRKLNG